MANVITFSIVSLAPLLMWSAVNAACAILTLLECAVLSAALRRDPDNRKIARPLSRARELAVLTGSLAIVFIAAHLRLGLDTNPARYADVQTFIVVACTACGWLAAILTAATLFGGVFALIAPATQVNSAEAAAAQWTGESETEGSVNPSPPQPKAFPDASAISSTLSAWIEVFLIINIVNLVVLTVTLLLRGPQALPNVVTDDPTLSVVISFAGAVLLPVFVIGITWSGYKSSPRASLATLALMDVLVGIAILYFGLHLLLR